MESGRFVGSLRRRRYTSGSTACSSLVERLRRTGSLDSTQAARPTTATPRWPRAWALEYDRFAVENQVRCENVRNKSLTALGGGERNYVRHPPSSSLLYFYAFALFYPAPLALPLFPPLSDRAFWGESGGQRSGFLGL